LNTPYKRKSYHVYHVLTVDEIVSKWPKSLKRAWAKWVESTPKLSDTNRLSNAIHLDLLPNQTAVESLRRRTKKPRRQ